MSPEAKLGARTARRLARYSRELARVESDISRSLGLEQPIRLCLLDEAAAVLLSAEDRERLPSPMPAGGARSTGR
jgi:hypothetical protein